MIILAQASATVLMSIIKPLLLVASFVPWAWLVSTKLEKDARYFHLNVAMWSGLYMAAGIAALALAVLIPIFWIGWPLAVLVLAAPVLAYWKVRNQEVPEQQRFALSGSQISDKLEQRRHKRAAGELNITFIDHDDKPAEVPLSDDPLHRVYTAAEELIEPATEARATHLELTPGKNGYMVFQTVDGVRYKREPIAADAANAEIDLLKELAGLDVSDRRRKQIGTFSINKGEGRNELTLSTSGASAGQIARIDFDLKNQLSKPFDGLGLLEPQLNALREFEEVHNRHGVILLGAPQGQGLTTSRYSFLDRHDAFTCNIKTLERRVELQLDGVDHVQFDSSNPDLDFATNLQSILRRDPDIVMISELEEGRTAEIAAGPGMEGPLIYIPIIQPTIGKQISEWAQGVGDLKKASKALRAVVNQRLLRSVCPNCRQSYQPSGDQARKLGLSEDKQHHLYRAGGKIQVKNKIEVCPMCKGTGYLGQTAAFEVMILDEKGRKMLGDGDLKGAYDHARRNKMIYLQEAALAKVRAGETTLEEVVRVISPDKPKPKPKPAAAATEA